MLIFNGKKYAATQSEFADSLFTPQTCNGFYKRVRGGIGMMDWNKQLQAMLVVNNHNEKFVVSAAMHDGKARYCFGASEATMKWLGIEHLSGQQVKDAIEAATSEPVAV